MIRRLQKFLYGFEYVLDALICDHVLYSPKQLPEGGIDLGITVRRWHPAYWCGVIRCRYLGDKCGRAIYEKKRAFIEWKTSESPRWYLRVGIFAVMYWPNEPWHRRLEFVYR